MCIYDVAERVETFTPEEYEAFVAAGEAVLASAKLLESGSASRFTVRTDIRSANYGPRAMNSPPWGIMLHHTAGDERSDIPTLTRRGTGVSSNDYVVKQGVIFELVPFPRRAWHAGPNTKNIGSYWSDGNSYYWGIEIENYGNGRDPYPQVQIDAVVWRCRQLRKIWPNIKHPEQIFRHRDYQAAKIDPSDNFPFAEVRRRILAPTDPTDETQPEPPAPPGAEPPATEPPAPPEPPKPTVLEMDFSAFGPEHLDTPKVVLTRAGEKKSVIVPYGVDGTPDEPDEPEKPDPPKPPEPPEPADPRAQIIDRYFGTKYGQLIIEEAKRAGLALEAACALVEQESNGRNIFGADWGVRGVDRVPFAHLQVTEARVKALVAHVRAGGVSNGIGLSQITWRDFIYQAEALGGAHIPRNQLRVGFALLASYFRKYGEPDGWGAYNAGEGARGSVRHTYSASCMAKRNAWARRLSGSPGYGAGAGKPENPAVRKIRERPVETSQALAVLVNAAFVYFVEASGGEIPAEVLASIVILVQFAAARIATHFTRSKASLEESSRE